MTPQDQRWALAGEAAAFHAAVGDLTTPVPACPDWRVGDLVRHLGSVHRLFRRVAEEGWTTRPGPVPDDPRPQAGDPAVAAWAREETRLLLDALEDLDPDAERWNFTPGPQVGAFIPRRMLHETAVHRHDLEEAYGRPSPIPPDVARDGVLEFLEVQLSRSGPWPDEPLRLDVEVDGDLVAHVILEPGEAARVTPGGPVPVAAPASAVTGSAPLAADVVLAGTGHELVLALWGRRPLAPVATGDTARLAAFRGFVRT